MTYHPPPPSEPNGCIQTLVISRIVFGILMIPLLMIIGVLFGVMIFLIAYSTHPLLGIAVLAVIGLAIYAFAKWEQRKVRQDYPDADL
jgi:membrane protein implicated in regulation of membrane protease activity